jgi:hypothetical protein
MASRKATKAEVTRNIRKGRAAQGVTKAGTKRKDRQSTRSADAAELSRADSLSEQLPQETSSDVADMSGRASGLSEDVGVSGPTAGELLKAGVAFGDLGDDTPAPKTAREDRATAEKEYWQDFGVTEAGKADLDRALQTLREISNAPRTGRSATPEERRVEGRTRATRAQKAISSARRSVEIDRATGLPTRVLPPDIALTESDALARQQFFLGDVGNKPRTTEPGVTKVPTIDETGTPREQTIVRPNRQYIASVQKTRVAPAVREAKEAQRMLDLAETMDKVKKTAASRVVDDPTVTPVTTVEINEAGNPEGRTSTTRTMTPLEAARLPQGDDDALTADERATLYGRPVGEVRSPGITRVVGETAISPQFREAVESKKAAAEAAQTDPITAADLEVMGGGSAQELVKEEDLTAYMDRLAKSKNPLRMETRPEPTRPYKTIDDPRQRARGLTGAAPLTDSEASELAQGLEGSNATERLGSMFKVTDPSRQADILKQLRAARVPEGSTVPIRKEAASPDVAEAVNTGTFSRVARGRRAIGRAAGRPIGSQTVDEAARITAAEDFLRRNIESDLMGGKDPTSTSQAAMHTRAPDARRTGRALDQTYLSRSGMADPTDEQIVLGQRAATHRAATDAVNQHIAGVEAHLFRQKQAATGYAQAAFSTIPKGSIGDVAAGVASLGSARAVAKSAGSGAAARYRAGAYWDRGPGGAGAVTSRVAPEEIAATDTASRAPEWTKSYVKQPLEQVVRPADTEADLAASRRKALMATPEGRASIESARTEGAEFLARPQVSSGEETPKAPSRPYEGMRSVPSAKTPYGYEGAASRAMTAMKLSGRTPDFGARMRQIAKDSQATGMSNILQPMSTTFPFSPGQEERGMPGVKYRTEGRSAPRNGGFFQRVANQGQFNQD